jgi:hypothetical protein
MNSPFYARRRQAQEATFGRYYDEPWFYQQQDPAYAMPMTVAQSSSNRPAARDEENGERERGGGETSPK